MITSAKVISVAMGPRAMLHRGIHEAALANHSDAVSITTFAGIHCAARRVRGRRLLEPLPSAEWTEGTPNVDVIHAVGFPVVGARRWIFDIDDVGYSLLCGHYGADPEYQNYIITALAVEGTKRRARVMLAAIAHDSCRRVLVRTAAEVERLREACHWAAPRLAGAVLAKTLLRPPSALPLEERQLHGKWSASTTPKVLFVGRWWEQKRGDIAMAVFGELARMHPHAEFVYIGPLPSEAVRGASALPNVRHEEGVAHERVLQEMATAHVLLHPAMYESVGMATIEAAANGMALVIGDRPGMAHVRHWFGTGVRAVQCRDRSLGEDSAAFAAEVDTLLRHMRDAAAAGIANWNTSKDGRLGHRAATAVVEECYREASAAAAQPLDEKAWLSGVKAEVARIPAEVAMERRAVRLRARTRDARAACEIVIPWWETEVIRKHGQHRG